MSSQIDLHTLSLIISRRWPDLEWDSFSPDEWDILMQKAQSEGVAPLIYWSLTKSGKLPTFPKQIVNHLRAMFATVKMANKTAIQELEILTDRFHQNDIPAVALKGICFALTIYPDPGLRPMGDLDLLIPKKSLSEAVQIAKSLGYHEAVPEASPGLRSLLNHEVCLKKGEAPYTVLELHHSLVADKTFAYAVPVDWFWGQTEPLPSLRDTNLLILTPTSQALYAAAHAMLQHGSRNTALRWYYDTDRLIRQYADRMDWDLLISQARAFEWMSAAEALFSKTVEFFDTPIPESVLDQLRKSQDRHVDRIVDLQNQPITHTHEEFQKLKFLDWLGRIRLILALIAPSPAYMRWRYGVKDVWLLPFYYLNRWWVILKDAIRTLVLLTSRVLPSSIDRKPYLKMFEKNSRKAKII